MPESWGEELTREEAISHLFDLVSTVSKRVDSKYKELLEEHRKNKSGFIKEVGKIRNDVEKLKELNVDVELEIINSAGQHKKAIETKLRDVVDKYRKFNTKKHEYKRYEQAERMEALMGEFQNAVEVSLNEMELMDNRFNELVNRLKRKDEATL